MGVKLNARHITYSPTLYNADIELKCGFYSFPRANEKPLTIQMLPALQ